MCIYIMHQLAQIYYSAQLKSQDILSRDRWAIINKGLLVINVHDQEYSFSDYTANSGIALVNHKQDNINCFW